MGIADELERLKHLHDSGELNDAEYEEAKAKLLASEGNESSGSGGGVLSSILGGDGDNSLAKAATTYINFRIVMGIIGFIGFIIVLLVIASGSHP